MGLFDFLGPTSLAKRRSAWDLAATAPAAPAPAVKSLPLPVSVPMGLPPEIMLRSLTYGFSDAGLYGSGADEDNSAVYACLQAIAVAIAEPPLAVYRRDGSGKVKLEDAEILRLFDRPNPHMTLDTLLAYAATSLHVSGNAYWRKLRAGDPDKGVVAELWPIAPYAISPYTAPGTEDFITSYRYQSEEISPANIIHFRYGLKDADHRVGMAPLARAYREVLSDAQATRYAERLLANFAINGLTLSFDKDAPAIDQATADELKARIMAAYGGDNVGSVSVLSPGAQLAALGFSPEQMDLKTLHRFPEERITADLGVPAVVAGLGAGLEHSIYNNVRQAEEHFTERKLLPLWRAMAGAITLQLLPDFTSDSALVVEFDTTDIRALADDQNELAVRLKVLVEAGILDVDEARAEIGYGPKEVTEPTPISAAAGASQTAAASRRPYEIRAHARKAAEQLPERYAELREASLPDWETELRTFLAAQERRVGRRLAAGADAAEDLVPEGEAILLGETLTPLQLRTLGEVSRLVMAELAISFTVDDPLTRRFLAAAGLNIGGITDATREDVRAALTAGQQAGEGIPQLARRLRDLPAFNQPRANSVARTELGTSQNLAALASYRASGVVVGVRVHDGDHDAACAAMNGRTFPLDQAPPALQHPNCVRAFAPLTDADALTASA